MGNTKRAVSKRANCLAVHARGESASDSCFVVTNAHTSFHDLDLSKKNDKELAHKKCNEHKYGENK
jgi:hypothetical protein